MPFDVSGGNPSCVKIPMQQYACRSPGFNSLSGRSPSSGHFEQRSGCVGGSCTRLKIVFGMVIDFIE